MLLAFAAHGYRFWSQSGVAFWFLFALILADFGRSRRHSWIPEGPMSLPRVPGGPWLIREPFCEIHFF